MKVDTGMIQVTGYPVRLVFQSPCGEGVMKEARQDGTFVQEPSVSVPLRGRGDER
jgi:hypothetical protein